MKKYKANVKSIAMMKIIGSEFVTVMSFNSPFLLKYFEMFRTLDAVFVTMEYVKGKDMIHMINKNQDISSLAIFKMIKDCVTAIQILH